MSFSERINLHASIDKIARLLTFQGKQGYIVGGFVRDQLLGRETNDIDIAVNGDAINIAHEVAKDIGGRFVLLDDVNRVARIVITVEDAQQWHLDFSSFSGDINSDLARRDFTINAMAVELGEADVIFSMVKQSQAKLIDPFSGKEDLHNGIIRAVSQQVFEVDAIRMLRALRLAAELDFSIEPETESLIRRYSQSIDKVPGERVREELLRLLILPRASQHLRYLDDLGLLMALIPELAESKGVEQPTTHYWDVFEHSMQTVAAIEFLIRESFWEYGTKKVLTTAPWSVRIDEHLSQEVSSGSNRKVLLKLAGLLHDIAKPMTKTVEPTGRARFLGHTKQGAAITADILERMRFSNREISLVETLVYYHLRPAQMTNEDLPTQRAIYRYFRDTDDAGIDILILALADYLATCGPHLNTEEWKGHCRLMKYVLTEHDKQQVNILPVKLIDGHDIINIFGLTAGPLIGELLATVRESQASGELDSKEEALALIQSELNRYTVKQR